MTLTCLFHASMLATAPTVTSRLSNPSETNLNSPCQYQVLEN